MHDHEQWSFISRGEGERERERLRHPQTEASNAQGARPLKAPASPNLTNNGKFTHERQSEPVGATKTWSFDCLSTDTRPLSIYGMYIVGWIHEWYFPYLATYGCGWSRQAGGLLIEYWFSSPKIPFSIKQLLGTIVLNFPRKKKVKSLQVKITLFIYSFHGNIPNDSN